MQNLRFTSLFPASLWLRRWPVTMACVNYSSAVGAGFYGNEEANKGLQHFIDAAEDVRETILGTQAEVEIRTLSVYCRLCSRLSRLIITLQNWSIHDNDDLLVITSTQGRLHHINDGANDPWKK